MPIDYNMLASKLTPWALSCILAWIGLNSRAWIDTFNWWFFMQSIFLLLWFRCSYRWEMYAVGFVRIVRKMVLNLIWLDLISKAMLYRLACYLIIIYATENDLYFCSFSLFAAVAAASAAVAVANGWYCCALTISIKRFCWVAWRKKKNIDFHLTHTHTPNYGVRLFQANGMQEDQVDCIDTSLAVYVTSS